ncbi:hypothetical protein IscW_ISCW009025 [Ixodes scapularis]|uniref:Secreted protein n=1 Tax=Ixodes scapularis TaxID=6945 RepID=B7Q375_IXOSC|nr:hypothetical protein IscW_ISCW009025 [Ixodes scapularis]|eukprot:XP_002411173.1 hypothetical protein IscW_ISCW009025 [Ixodes scapularis]
MSHLCLLWLRCSFSSPSPSLLGIDRRWGKRGTGDETKTQQACARLFFESNRWSNPDERTSIVEAPPRVTGKTSRPISVRVAPRGRSSRL